MQQDRRLTSLPLSFHLQPNQISMDENTLVSRYINNPLLIDGESASIIRLAMTCPLLIGALLRHQLCRFFFFF